MSDKKTAIIPETKPKNIDPESKKSGVGEKTFIRLAREIYDLMIQISHHKKIAFTKKYPLMLGGVNFWFELNDGEYKLTFNSPPTQWDENNITYDININLYNLYV